MRKETEKIWKQIAKLREDLLQVFKRHDESLERHSEVIEKNSEEIRKLREDLLHVFERMDRHMSALRARWGLMTEEAFREGLTGFLEEELELSIERWVEHDEEGMVYGFPSMVEVDLSISDERTTLIEISSHVKSSEAFLFLRKAEFYEKATGQKPDRLLMVTPYAEKEALKAAKKFGIEIYTKV